MNIAKDYAFCWEPTDSGTARLLRVYGTLPDVVLPDTVAGYPLTEIGDYCFAETEHINGHAVTEGIIREDMHALCGNHIENLVLPDGIGRIGNLAFYNCRKLTSLQIGAQLAAVGSDAFMNCRSLRELKMHCALAQPSGLSLILAQIHADLTVQFVTEEGVETSLFYPEYYESYDEIGPAHIFAMHISGEGFRARQCIRDGVVDTASYDAVFPRICIEESTDTAAKMAMNRLQYPTLLSQEARVRYETFVKENAITFAPALVTKKNLTWLSVLCENDWLSKEVMAKLIHMASQDNWPEGAASLMRWQQERYAKEKKERYCIEAW